MCSVCADEPSGSRDYIECEGAFFLDILFGSYFKAISESASLLKHVHRNIIDIGWTHCLRSLYDYVKR